MSAGPRGPGKAMARNIKKLLRRLNLYPPFLGAGIHVRRISEDFRTIDVEMPLRFWNRNYVGTHFGGSLYAMCDPFFMVMLIEKPWAGLHCLGQGRHHPL